MRKFSLIIAFLILSSFANAEEKTNSFQSFTGKITGSKVRLRTGADLDSLIISQLNKGELFLVVGETRDFYAVRPPEKTKLYVFSSYIVNNTVEAHRVNIRLRPSLDAPVIGRLQNKAKINGQALANNPKWIAITPPQQICFYVAKDYVKKAGDTNYYLAVQKQKTAAAKTNNAIAVNQAPRSKNAFETLNLKSNTPVEKSEKTRAVSETLKKETQNIAKPIEFPAEKKIMVLDLSSDDDNAISDVSASATAIEIISSPSVAITPKKISSTERKQKLAALEKVDMSRQMKTWLPVEAELFSSWSTFHPEKEPDDFYKEQLASGLEIEGVLENFTDNIQQKPGDYLIKVDNMPVAYLYSTQVNLHPYLNQKVSVRVTPRPNNNFAFPAYFVLEID